MVRHSIRSVNVHLCYMVLQSQVRHCQVLHKSATIKVDSLAIFTFHRSVQLLSLVYVKLIALHGDSLALDSDRKG